MKVTPLQDWAVIRPTGADEMTAGGIIIPDTAKEKPHEGVVEAIGPGALEEEKYGKKKVEKKDRRFIPTTVKPGDCVLYEQYAGQTYTVSGEELVLVRERNILGILPERQPRQAPLQIPARTSSSGSTALMASTKSVAPKRAVLKKKATKKAAKKAAKKASKKPAKKAAKKTVKKAVKKAAKKTAKPSAKPAKGRKASAKKSAKKKK
jgi:chaperonin GroES